jgi:hypothetical protein
MLNRLIAAYFVEVRVSRKEGHNRQLPDKPSSRLGQNPPFVVRNLPPMNDGFPLDAAN